METIISATHVYSLGMSPMFAPADPTNPNYIYTMSPFLSTCDVAVNIMRYLMDNSVALLFVSGKNVWLIAEVLLWTVKFLKID